MTHEELLQKYLDAEEQAEKRHFEMLERRAKKREQQKKEEQERKEKTT